MVDPKKIANNILDFLIDPTKIPVQTRLYFRPEENLRNEVYEKAKADAFAAYGEQKHNSDFYPAKNRQITNREASHMDRKSIIASIDILSRNFRENDPIGTDLRTMALAMSKMSEDEFAKRILESAPNFEGMEVEAKKQVKMFKCPDCGTKVMEQTKYCLKCKKKVEPPKTAAEEEKEEPEVKEEEVEASQDFWSKEASSRIAKALVADVLGIVASDDEDDKGEEKEPEEPKDAATEEKEVEAPKKAPIVPEEKKEDVEAAKKPEEKKEPEACAMKAKEEKAPVVEEKEPEEKESKIVNTDILASITFGDIQMEAPVGVLSADEAGEMSAEEKNRLAQLFQ